MSARYYSRPRALSSVLREMRAKEPWGGRLAGHFVFRVWSEAVGAGIARAARPVSLTRGRLLVEVADSSWLYELDFRKEELLERLNECLEGARVDEIRFRLANAGAPFAAGRDEQEPPPPRGTPIAPGDEDAIEDAITGVEDAQLRRAVHSLIRRVRERGNSL